MIALGNAIDQAEHQDNYVVLFMTLKDGILEQLKDIRSAVVKAASKLVISMVRSARESFEPMANQLLPQLLNLSMVTIKVISQSGIDCIDNIIRFSKLDLSYFVRACIGSKNVGVRLCAMNALITVFEQWNEDDINISECIKAVDSCIHDANENVRERGRAALIVLSDAVPGNDDILTNLPQGSMRKLFTKEYPKHRLSQKMQLPPEKRMSFLKHRYQRMNSADVPSSVEINLSTCLKLAPLQSTMTQKEST